MRYKRLGTSGLKVSVIGLGGNTFGRYVDAPGTARIIHRAIDLGINFFDTADVYSIGVSEDHVGKALADRRDRGLIASKVAMKMGEGPNEQGLSRGHIIAGVEASLRRLGTDYLDLLQVHSWDPETPIEETMRALDDLVRAGKVRYLGCSNFTAWQLTQSLWVSDKRGYAPFVSVQPRYSLLDRRIEAELVPPAAPSGSGLSPTARWRAESSPASIAAGRGPRARAAPTRKGPGSSIDSWPARMRRRSSGWPGGPRRAARRSATWRSPGWPRSPRSPPSSPGSPRRGRSKRMPAPPSGN
jgi:hypothetical protein